MLNRIYFLFAPGSLYMFLNNRYILIVLLPKSRFEKFDFFANYYACGDCPFKAMLLLWLVLTPLCVCVFAHACFCGGGRRGRRLVLVLWYSFCALSNLTIVLAFIDFMLVFVFVCAII